MSLQRVWCVGVLIRIKFIKCLWMMMMWRTWKSNKINQWLLPSLVKCYLNHHIRTLTVPNMFECEKNKENENSSWISKSLFCCCKFIMAMVVQRFCMFYDGNDSCRRWQIEIMCHLFLCKEIWCTESRWTRLTDDCNVYTSFSFWA